MRCPSCGNLIIESNSFNNDIVQQLFQGNEIVVENIKFSFINDKISFLCPKCLNEILRTREEFLQDISFQDNNMNNSNTNTNSDSNSNSSGSSSTGNNSSVPVSNSDISLPDPVEIYTAICLVELCLSNLGDVKVSIDDFDTLGLDLDGADAFLPGARTLIASFLDGGSNIMQRYNSLKEVDALIRKYDANYELYVAAGYLEQLSNGDGKLKVNGTELNDLESALIFEGLQDSIKENEGSYTVDAKDYQNILGALTSTFGFFQNNAAAMLTGIAFGDRSGIQQGILDRWYDSYNEIHTNNNVSGGKSINDLETSNVSTYLLISADKMKNTADIDEQMKYMNNAYEVSESYYQLKSREYLNGNTDVTAEDLANIRSLNIYFASECQNSLQLSMAELDKQIEEIDGKIETVEDATVENARKNIFGSLDESALWEYEVSNGRNAINKADELLKTNEDYLSLEEQKNNLNEQRKELEEKYGFYNDMIDNMYMADPNFKELSENPIASFEVKYSVGDSKNAGSYVGAEYDSGASKQLVFKDKDGNIIEDVSVEQAALYFAQSGERIPFGIDNRSELKDMVNYLDSDYIEEKDLQLMNYYANTLGIDYTAAKLDSLIDEALYLEGQEMANNIIDKIDGKETELGVMTCIAWQGFKDGIQTFGEGFVNLFSDDRRTSAREIKNGILNEYLANDLSSSYQGLYEFSNVMGNMAPSIAIGLLTGGTSFGAFTVGKLTLSLGSISMGVSAAGNSKRALLQQGATTNQALLYGILSGGSETVLGSILGSIPGISNMEKFSNLSGLAGFVAKGASEAFEEGTQEFIDPFLQLAVSKTIGDNDFYVDSEGNKVTSLSQTWNMIDLEAIGHSGLYGFLSAGLLGSPSLGVDFASYLTTGDFSTISTINNINFNNNYSNMLKSLPEGTGMSIKNVFECRKMALEQTINDVRNIGKLSSNVGDIKSELASDSELVKILAAHNVGKTFKDKVGQQAFLSNIAVNTALSIANNAKTSDVNTETIKQIELKMEDALKDVSYYEDLMNKAVERSNDESLSSEDRMGASIEANEYSDKMIEAHNKYVKLDGLRTVPNTETVDIDYHSMAIQIANDLYEPGTEQKSFVDKVKHFIGKNLSKNSLFDVNKTTVDNYIELKNQLNTLEKELSGLDEKSFDNKIYTYQEYTNLLKDKINSLNLQIGKIEERFNNNDIDTSKIFEYVKEREKLDNLDNEINRLSKEAEAIKNKLEEMKKASEEVSDEKYQGLLTEIENLKKQKANIESGIETSESLTYIGNIDNEIDRLSKEADTMKNKLEQMKKSSEEVSDEKYQKLLAEIKILEEERNISNKNIELLNININDINDKINIVDIVLDNSLLKLGLGNKFKELYNKYLIKENVETKIDEKIDEKVSSEEVTEEQYQKLLTEIENLKEQRINIENGIETSESLAYIENINNEIDRLSKEAETMKNKLEEMKNSSVEVSEEQYQKLLTEIENLKEQRINIENGIETSESLAYIENINNEIDRLSKEAETMKNKLEEMKVSDSEIVENIENSSVEEISSVTDSVKAISQVISSLNTLSTTSVTEENYQKIIDGVNTLKQELDKIEKLNKVDNIDESSEVVATDSMVESIKILGQIVSSLIPLSMAPVNTENYQKLVSGVSSLKTEMDKIENKESNIEEKKEDNNSENVVEEKVQFVINQINSILSLNENLEEKLNLLFENIAPKDINKYLNESLLTTEQIKIVMDNLSLDILSNYFIYSIENSNVYQLFIDRLFGDGSHSNLEFYKKFFDTISLNEEKLNLIKEQVNNNQFVQSFTSFYLEINNKFREQFNNIYSINIQSYLNLLLIPELTSYLCQDINSFSQIFDIYINIEFDDMSNSILSKIDLEKMDEYINDDNLDKMSLETREKFQKNYPGVIDKILEKSNRNVKDFFDGSKINLKKLLAGGTAEVIDVSTLGNDLNDGDYFSYEGYSYIIKSKNILETVNKLKGVNIEGKILLEIKSFSKLTADMLTDISSNIEFRINDSFLNTMESFKIFSYVSFDIEGMNNFLNSNSKKDIVREKLLDFSLDKIWSMNDNILFQDKIESMNASGIAELIDKNNNISFLLDIFKNCYDSQKTKNIMSLIDKNIFENIDINDMVQILQFSNTRSEICKVLPSDKLKNFIIDISNIYEIKRIVESITDEQRIEIFNSFTEQEIDLMQQKGIEIKNILKFGKCRIEDLQKIIDGFKIDSTFVPSEEAFNNLKNYIDGLVLSNSEISTLKFMMYIEVSKNVSLEQYGDIIKESISNDYFGNYDTLNDALKYVTNWYSMLMFDLYDSTASIHEVREVTDNINVELIGNDRTILELYYKNFEDASKMLPKELYGVSKELQTIKIYDVADFGNLYAALHYYDDIKHECVSAADHNRNTGVIRFFFNEEIPEKEILFEYLSHELGHAIDNKVGKGEHWTEISNEWLNAQQEDKKLSNEDAVTEYGKTKIYEDFAESVRFYALNRNEFYNKFPNRCKILDEIFENLAKEYGVEFTYGNLSINDLFDDGTAEVIDVSTLEVDLNNNFDDGSKNEISDMNFSYKGYDYVLKPRNLFETISKLSGVNVDGRILLELENTNELTLDMLSNISNNVEIRIIGGYTFEYFNSFKSPKLSGEATLSHVTFNIEEMKNILTKLNEFDAGIDENWSSMEKAKYAYDYIRNNVKYEVPVDGNVDRGKQYDGLLGLVVGESTCQGFAEIYYNLLTRMGIECYTITGSLSGEGQHAFNVVSIDGSDYIVDTTRESLDINAKNKDVNNKQYEGTGFLVDNFSQYRFKNNTYLLEQISEHAINEICTNENVLLNAIETGTYRGVDINEVIEDIYQNKDSLQLTDEVLKIIGDYKSKVNNNTGNISINDLFDEGTAEVIEVSTLGDDLYEDNHFSYDGYSYIVKTKNLLDTVNKLKEVNIEGKILLEIENISELTLDMLTDIPNNVEFRIFETEFASYVTFNKKEMNEYLNEDYFERYVLIDDKISQFPINKIVSLDNNGALLKKLENVNILEVSEFINNNFADKNYLHALSTILEYYDNIGKLTELTSLLDIGIFENIDIKNIEEFINSNFVNSNTVKLLSSNKLKNLIINKIDTSDFSSSMEFIKKIIDNVSDEQRIEILNNFTAREVELSQQKGIDIKYILNNVSIENLQKIIAGFKIDSEFIPSKDAFETWKNYIDELLLSDEVKNLLKYMMYIEVSKNVSLEQYGDIIKDNISKWYGKKFKTLNDALSSVTSDYGNSMFNLYDSTASINEVREVSNDIKVQLIGNNRAVLELYYKNFEASLKFLPRELYEFSKHIDTIKIYDVPNFNNDYFSVVYNKNIQKSFYSAADAWVRFYYNGGAIPSAESIKLSLSHELGHKLDKKVGNGVYWTKNSKAWMEAQQKDKKISNKDAVSDYGEQNVLEDFAESVELYTLNRNEFYNKFPNRCKILDKMFENLAKEYGIEFTYKNDVSSIGGIQQLRPEDIENLVKQIRMGMEAMDTKYGQSLAFDRLAEYIKTGNPNLLSSEGGFRQFITSLNRNILIECYNQIAAEYRNFSNIGGIQQIRAEDIENLVKQIRMGMEAMDIKYGQSLAFNRLAEYIKTGNPNLLSSEGGFRQFVTSLDRNTLIKCYEKIAFDNKMLEQNPTAYMSFISNAQLKHNIKFIVRDFIAEKLQANPNFYKALVLCNTPLKKIPTVENWNQFNNRFSYSNYVKENYGGFLHIRGNNFSESIDHRLYINAEYAHTYKFLELFATECDKRNIPFYFKTSIINFNNAFAPEFKRSETAVIYSSAEYIVEYTKICQKIKLEHPELQFYSPPVATSSIDNWLGYAMEPSKFVNEKLSKLSNENRHSFNDSRTYIILEAIERGIKEFIITNTDAKTNKLFIDGLYSYIVNSYNINNIIKQKQLYRKLSTDFRKFIQLLQNGSESILIDNQYNISMDSYFTYLYNYVKDDNKLYDCILKSISEVSDYYGVDSNNFALNKDFNTKFIEPMIVDSNSYSMNTSYVENSDVKNSYEYTDEEFAKPYDVAKKSEIMLEQNLVTAKKFESLQDVAEYFGDSNLYLFSVLRDMYRKKQVSYEEFRSLKQDIYDGREDGINKMIEKLNDEELNTYKNILSNENDSIQGRWLSKLSFREISKIRDYAKYFDSIDSSDAMEWYGYDSKGRSYVTINELMRHGLSSGNNNLDSAIEKFGILPSEIVTYRGVGLGSLTSQFGNIDIENLDSLIGSIYTDKAYMSSSLLESKAHAALGKTTDVILNIIVPTDANYGAYIESKAGLYYGQMEFLIKKNSSLVVENAYINEDGKIVLEMRLFDMKNTDNLPTEVLEVFNNYKESINNVGFDGKEPVEKFNYLKKKMSELIKEYVLLEQKVKSGIVSKSEIQRFEVLRIENILLENDIKVIEDSLSFSEIIKTNDTKLIKQKLETINDLTEFDILNSIDFSSIDFTSLEVIFEYYKFYGKIEDILSKLSVDNIFDMVMNLDFGDFLTIYYEYFNNSNRLFVNELTAQQIYDIVLKTNIERFYNSFGSRLDISKSQEFIDYLLVEDFDLLLNAINGYNRKFQFFGLNSFMEYIFNKLSLEQFLDIFNDYKGNYWNFPYWNFVTDIQIKNIYSRLSLDDIEKIITSDYFVFVSFLPYLQDTQIMKFSNYTIEKIHENCFINGRDFSFNTLFYRLSDVQKIEFIKSLNDSETIMSFVGNLDVELIAEILDFYLNSSDLQLNSYFEKLFLEFYKIDSQIVNKFSLDKVNSVFAHSGSMFIKNSESKILQIKFNDVLYINGNNLYSYNVLGKTIYCDFNLFEDYLNGTSDFKKFIEEKYLKIDRINSKVSVLDGYMGGYIYENGIYKKTISYDIRQAMENKRKSFLNFLENARNNNKNRTFGVDQKSTSKMSINSPFGSLKLATFMAKKYNMYTNQVKYVMRYLDSTGACSYADCCNKIFMMYKDNPTEFRKNFGYDMYVNGKLNSESLLLDLYIYANIDKNGGRLLNFDNSTGKTIISKDYNSKNQVYLSNSARFNIDVINRFLSSNNSKKYVDFEILKRCNGTFEIEKLIQDVKHRILQDEYVSISQFKAEKVINFHNLDVGSDHSTSLWNEGDGHITTIVDVTNEGFIVVSWGEKYLIKFEDLTKDNFMIKTMKVRENL